MSIQIFYLLLVCTLLFFTEFTIGQDRQSNVSIKIWNDHLVTDYSTMISNEMCKSKWEKALSLEPRSNKVDTIHCIGIGCPTEVIKKYKGNSILIVHVGKTGGTAVIFAFKRAKIHFQQIHMHPFSVPMLDRFDQIIITVREPVERVISGTETIHNNMQYGIY